MRQVTVFLIILFIFLLQSGAFSQCDNDNSFEEAVSYTPGTWKQGNVCEGLDEDYYVFDLDTSKCYDIILQQLTSGGVFSIEIYRTVYGYYTYQDDIFGPRSPLNGTEPDTISLQYLAPFCGSSSHNPFYIMVFGYSSTDYKFKVIERPDTNNNIETTWKHNNHYKLYQNCPNPCKPATTIRYSIPIKSNVTLEVYDLKGGLINTLYSGVRNPGHYNVMWNGKFNDGKIAASGIYLYKLSTDKEKEITKHLILIK